MLLYVVQVHALRSQLADFVPVLCPLVIKEMNEHFLYEWTHTQGYGISFIVGK